VSFVFDIVDEKNWAVKFLESLDISDHGSFSNIKFRDARILIPGIEHSSPSLTMPNKGKTSFKPQGPDNLLYKLARKSPNNRFPARRPSIPRTINRSHSEPVLEADPDHILVKQVVVGVSGVSGAGAVQAEDQGLRGSADYLGVDHAVALGLEEPLPQLFLHNS
jgi:hypothetical protein